MWTRILVSFLLTAQFVKANYEYLGCFPDEPNDRDLPFTAMTADATMTIEKCFQLCVAKGPYLYFGLQWGDECYCGNNPGKHMDPPYSPASVEDEGLCRDLCWGDLTQICGGFKRNSVYRIVSTDTISCNPGEYLCADKSQCIVNEFYCDGGTPDCNDGSDELPGCSKDDLTINPESSTSSSSSSSSSSTSPYSSSSTTSYTSYTSSETPQTDTTPESTSSSSFTYSTSSTTETTTTNEPTTTEEPTTTVTTTKTTTTNTMTTTTNTMTTTTTVTDTTTTKTMTTTTKTVTSTTTVITTTQTTTTNTSTTTTTTEGVPFYCDPNDVSSKDSTFEGCTCPGYCRGDPCRGIVGKEDEAVCATCPEGYFRLRGRCITKAYCKGNEVQTGALTGQDCSCVDKNCFYCIRYPWGDQCNTCRNGLYHYNSTCVESCPSHLTNSGKGDFARRCLEPFTCFKQNLFDGDVERDVGYGCKCYDSNCLQCEFEAGGHGEKCTKCRKKQFLHENECLESCPGDLIEYIPGNSGRECRSNPFICRNGFEEGTNKACLCKKSVRDNCVACSIEKEGTTCTECKTGFTVSATGTCIRETDGL